MPSGQRRKPCTTWSRVRGSILSAASHLVKPVHTSTGGHFKNQVCLKRAGTEVPALAFCQKASRFSPSRSFGRGEQAGQVFVGERVVQGLHEETRSRTVAIDSARPKSSVVIVKSG